jgi:polyphosphate glucokinase
MASTRKTTVDKAPSATSRILAIDIGGTGLKAAVLSFDGEMVSERIRIQTPRPITRELLVESLMNLVEPLADYDVVSVGFPGVVRHGIIITAPNLGTEEMKGLDLAAELQNRFGKPTRVINDADMQGYGAIEGKGLEMVVTLGTGFGSALFMDGELAPHLELAHLPLRKGETFEQLIGDKARKKLGRKRWNRRVKRAIEFLRILTNFDKLYIGGGNASKLDLKLDSDVKTISNDAGIKGGAWLWHKND